MSSIFSGLNGLRHQYFDISASNMSGANSPATAKLLGVALNVTSLIYLDNTLNEDIKILLCHPDADSTVAANRLFWIELPSQRVINYEALGAGRQIDPGTKVFVYCSTNPTTGKMRMILW